MVASDDKTRITDLGDSGLAWEKVLHWKDRPAVKLAAQVVDSLLELSEIQLDKTIVDLILWQLHFKEKAEIDDFQRFCPTNI